MSDLHRAVQDRIAAHIPSGVPPFEAIADHKRARDRRRNTVAGVALSVLAVTGIAVGSSTLTGDGQGRPPSYAEPDRSGQTEQTEQPRAAAERLCAVVARVYDGEVAGAYPTTVGEVRDYMETPGSATGARDIRPGPFEFPQGWAEKAPKDTAAVCYVDGDIPTPGPPGPEKPDRAMVLAADAASSFLVKAGRGSSLLPGPLPTDPVGLASVVPAPADVTGLGICRISPEGPCTSLSEAQADAVAAALREAAEPLDPYEPVCSALGVRYRLVFFAGMEQYGPVHLETACAPLEAAGQRYSIPQEVRDEIDRAYGAAAGILLSGEPTQGPPDPAPTAVTPGRTDFSECLGVPSDPAACTENLPGPGEG